MSLGKEATITVPSLRTDSRQVGRDFFSRLCHDSCCPQVQRGRWWGGWGWPTELQSQDDLYLALSPSVTWAGHPGAPAGGLAIPFSLG